VALWSSAASWTETFKKLRYGQKEKQLHFPSISRFFCLFVLMLENQRMRAFSFCKLITGFQVLMLLGGPFVLPIALAPTNSGRSLTSAGSEELL